MKFANHITARYEHCAKGSYVGLLADIQKWLSARPSDTERILWVTGIAGGKSTFSATIVDNLRNNHTPVADQFSISRNMPETIDAEKISSLPNPLRQPLV
jgi:hypothetical protein